MNPAKMLRDPDLTDAKIQRVKIPACPDCNNPWENDEAHFKTMLVLCGSDSTPARRQLWEDPCAASTGRDTVSKKCAPLLRNSYRPQYLMCMGRPFSEFFHTKTHEWSGY